MAGHAPELEPKKFPDLKVAVISASWHPEICQALIDGAVRGFEQSGVSFIQVRRVSGSFELPLAAQFALDAGFDAAVVVGLILRGQTPHFDYVCQGVTKGIIDVSLKHGKPIGFGVLMCNDLEQAVARSGRAGSKEDKGYDSAVAVIELLHLKS